MAVNLGPVERASSLTEKVADTMLASILAGQWQPGERLPPERELGASLQVSRTVIRESIRYLAAKGVVEVLAGSGARVTEVQPSAVRETMSLYLHGQSNIGYTKIHEVRAMIEVHVAALAARVAQPESLARLRAISANMAAVIDDAGAFAQLDIDFHRTVGAATGNELFVTVLDSIGDVLLKVRLLTSESRDRREQALVDHEQILAAIERRDPLAAEQAMEAHLAYTLRVCQDLETGALTSDATP